MCWFTGHTQRVCFCFCAPPPPVLWLIFLINDSSGELLQLVEKVEHSPFHLFKLFNSSPSPLLPVQSTGSASTSNQAPNWKVAPPPSTCATTCWSSPGASLLSSSAAGSCRRCVGSAPCRMALCSKEGPAVDCVSNPEHLKFN